MLTEKENKWINKKLSESGSPLFLFDDDPDGLCSFMLLRKFTGQGDWIIKRNTSTVDNRFLEKTNRHIFCDNIFILDVPIVSQDYLDNIKQTAIWIDHHQPLKRNKVKYFNPRTHQSDIYYPVTKVCWDVVRNDIPQYSWIAMIGCMGDFFVSDDLIEDFKKDYGDLLPKGKLDPGKLRYDSKLGPILRIFTFALKGYSSRVRRNINLLLKMKTPYDLLDSENNYTKLLKKHTAPIEEYYDRLFKRATKNVSGKILMFNYQEEKHSLTSELSTHLSYLYPKKIIFVCREKDGEMRCSLRARNYNLPKLIEKSLHGCEGTGGGHENASGLLVKKRDFDRFMKQFKEGMKQQTKEQ